MAESILSHYLLPHRCGVCFSWFKESDDHAVMPCYTSHLAPVAQSDRATASLGYGHLAGNRLCESAQIQGNLSTFGWWQS